MAYVVERIGHWNLIWINQMLQRKTKRSHPPLTAWKADCHLWRRSPWKHSAVKNSNQFPEHSVFREKMIVILSGHVFFETSISELINYEEMLWGPQAAQSFPKMLTQSSSAGLRTSVMGDYWPLCACHIDFKKKMLTSIFGSQLLFVNTVFYFIQMVLDRKHSIWKKEFCSLSHLPFTL